MGAPKVTHARNSLRGMLPMIWYDMTWHDMTWHNLRRKNVTLHDIELTAATSFFWPGWVFVPKCLKCIWRIIRSKCLLLAHERSRRKSCSLQFCKVDDSTSPTPLNLKGLGHQNWYSFRQSPRIWLGSQSAEDAAIESCQVDMWPKRFGTDVVYSFASQSHWRKVDEIAQQTCRFLPWFAKLTAIQS